MGFWEFANQHPLVTLLLGWGAFSMVSSVFYAITRSTPVEDDAEDEDDD